MTAPSLATWRVIYVETRCHITTVQAPTAERAEAIAEERYLHGCDETKWFVKCIEWKHHDTEEVQP